MNIYAFEPSITVNDQGKPVGHVLLNGITVWSTTSVTPLDSMSGDDIIDAFAYKLQELLNDVQ